MAGPPVEVQVRVNTGGSVAGSVSNWKVMSLGIVTCPVECIKATKDVTQLHGHGSVVMTHLVICVLHLQTVTE